MPDCCGTEVENDKVALAAVVDVVADNLHGADDAVEVAADWCNDVGAVAAAVGNDVAPVTLAVVAHTWAVPGCSKMSPHSPQQWLVAPGQGWEFVGLRT